MLCGSPAGGRVHAACDPMAAPAQRRPRWPAVEPAGKGGDLEAIAEDEAEDEEAWGDDDQGESQSFTLGVVVARDHEIVYLGGHEDEAARVQFVVQALVLRRLRIAEL